MEKFANDNLLSDRENRIKELINSGDKRYLDVFTFIYRYYKFNYRLRKSNHYLVFKAIYIENLELTKWNIANYCHLSESSFYRLRNEIIDCFYTCLEENYIFEEIAITKG